MYQYMYANQRPVQRPGTDDRFVPFLAPFLLGGIGGLAVAPLFARPPYPVPYPAPYPVPYQTTNQNYYRPY